MNNCCEKNWIDILSALLMPTIAFFGSIIAWRQSKINQNRLKHELFTRRIELFDEIAHYIADIICYGNVEQGKDAQFLRNTRTSFFIFNKEIEEYIDKIYKESIKLQLLCNLKNSSTGQDLENNISEQKIIKDWFKKELNGLRPKFQQYLKL